MAVVALAASPAAAFDAQLGWGPVQSVAGYRVYVRQAGQSYGAGSDIGLVQPDASGVVQYIIPGLPTGVTNYFAVTDYDAAGRESGLSNELALLVNPTATPTASRTATATAGSTSQISTATNTASQTATQTAPASATRTPPNSPTPTATTGVTSAYTASRTATATATRSGTSGAVTIWGSTATPANPAEADTAAVELGVRFTSDVNGLITGIRFYKSTTNTGTHTGSLWSNAGVRLATATFTNETTSGWQQVNFSTPVTITSGTVYVASYHTDVGQYADDINYFATAGVDNPPLHALRDGVSGANSVYAYGASAFPTNSYLSSNYWVDVVFSPDTSATPTAVAKTSTATATTTLTVAPTATRTAPPTPTRTATSSPTPSPTPSPLVGPTMTIWGSKTKPVNASVSDGSAVEVGVKFKADVNGLIAGVRFYKGRQNTGTHTATLWNSAGAALATATFINETKWGWQQVKFSTPVAITAGTVYIASYHTAVGHYAADPGYFSTTGYDNPPLHALRDGVSGGNGVLVYGASAFPTNSYQSSNYWVDVVFIPTP